MTSSHVHGQVLTVDFIYIVTVTRILRLRMENSSPSYLHVCAPFLKVPIKYFPLFLAIDTVIDKR